MKKNLSVALALCMLVSFPILTACSDNTKDSQAVPPSYSDTGSDSISIKSSISEISTLEEMLNGLNNHQINGLMDLFNENATLTQVYPYDSGAISPLSGLSYPYKGKEEIRGWLEIQNNNIIGIVPKDSKVTINSVSLQVLFYYSNRVEEIRMDAENQDGRFDSLYFNIEKISYS